MSNCDDPLVATAPHCDEFAGASDTNFTYYFPSYAAINSIKPPYAYSWTIVDSVITGNVTVAPFLSAGVDAWVKSIYATGDTTARVISSAYRNPVRQYATSTKPTRTPRSQHMLGDAIDMQLHGPFDLASYNLEWNRVAYAARHAGADWIEGLDGSGPCVPGGIEQHCVHADWRGHQGHAYVNP